MEAKRIEKLDNYLLLAVVFAILAVVAINFITSYQHIYDEGLRYGEYGVDARLMPIGIDGALLALGLANVFAARFERNHWLLRAALAFSVGGTVLVNGAYGARWGMTGGLLGVWSPIALFITVESGLFMFRVAADVVAEAQAQVITPKPRAPRAPRTPKTPDKPAAYTGGSEVAVPVIRGHVDPRDPFRHLRETA